MSMFNLLFTTFLQKCFDVLSTFGREGQQNDSKAVSGHRPNTWCGDVVIIQGEVSVRYQLHHKGLISRGTCFRPFLKGGPTKRSKGWTFLIPGEFTDRPEIHIIVFRIMLDYYSKLHTIFHKVFCLNSRRKYKEKCVGKRPVAPVNIIIGIGEWFFRFLLVLLLPDTKVAPATFKVKHCSTKKHASKLKLNWN